MLVAGYRLKTWLVVLISLISMSAFGDGNRLTRVLSYSELMQMTPDAQAGYIQNLRLILFEFEVALADSAVSTDIAKKASAQMMFLRAFISEAEAAGIPKYKGTIKDAWFASQNESSCRSEVRSTYTMESLRKLKAKVACPPLSMRTCPYGFKPLVVIHGQRVCQLNSSNIKMYQRGQEPKKQIAKAAQAKRPKAKLNIGPRQLAAAKKPTGRRSETRLESPQTTPEASANDDASVVTAKEAESEAASDELEPLQLTDKDEPLHAAKIHGPSPETWELVIKPGYTRVMQEEDAELKKCGAPSPIADPMTCRASTIATAKRDFYRSREPHCFYAGNITHFQNSSKKPGNCQSPNKFCLDTLSCTHADGAPATTMKPAFECKNPNEVICNPYIFPLVDSVARIPLCVPRGPDAMATCDREAKKLPNQSPFLLSVNNLNGVYEGWNQFAKAVDSMCEVDPMKGYFCNECALLKSRLFEARLTGVMAPRPGQSKPQAACHMIKHLGDGPATTNSTKPAAPAGAGSAE